MLEEKLNKRLAVSLTRIDDTSPRRKSTSDDDSTASGPTRSPSQSSAQPRLSRKSSSDSNNSSDMKLEKDDKPKAPYRSPVKKHKKHVHLTKYELEGLIEVVSWIDSLPPNKKGIPKDLIDPETVLKEIKVWFDYPFLIFLFLAYSVYQLFSFFQQYIVLLSFEQ